MTAAEFHQQQLEQQQWESARSKMTPVYCDKIASVIKHSLNAFDHDNVIVGCGPVKFDLDDYGSLATTKKTLFCVDNVGRTYKITVEEA